MTRFDDATPTVRARMAHIRKTNSKPELIVRRLAHQLGYRFRLHRGDLPGTPDLVFPSRRKVIFVHGCFWHRHTCVAGRKEPSSRRDYWIPKLLRNASRDRETLKAIQSIGWEALVIWECEVKDEHRLKQIITAFLGPSLRASSASV